MLLAFSRHHRLPSHAVIRHTEQPIERALQTTAAATILLVESDNGKGVHTTKTQERQIITNVLDVPIV